MLVVVAALVLLPRPAWAEDCGIIPQPGCTSTTTQPTTSSTVKPTTSTSLRSTTTTDDDRVTTTTEDDGFDEEPTSTTNRTRTTEQEIVTTTTLTVTTLHDVLIPGDGTAGAESTTTTSAPTATGDSGLSDSQLILIIVAALGTVGVVAGVLTWRYWSATRPRIVEAPRDTRPLPGPAARSVFLDEPS